MARDLANSMATQFVHGSTSPGNGAPTAGRLGGFYCKKTASSFSRSINSLDRSLSMSCLMDILQPALELLAFLFQSVFPVEFFCCAFST